MNICRKLPALVIALFLSWNCRPPRLVPHTSFSSMNDAAYLLTITGEMGENDVVENLAPANSTTFARGAAVDFKWRYNGFYLVDPSDGNDASKCIGSGLRANRVRGGVFKAYRLRITWEYYLDLSSYTLLEVDSTEPSAKIALDLPAGEEYFWQVALVIQNSGACGTNNATLDLIAAQRGSFKIE